MVNKKVLGLFFTTLLFASCNSSWLPVSIDKSLGEQSKNQLNSDAGFVTILDEEEYPKVYGKLKEIRNKILKSSKLEHKSDFSWEIKVIEDDSTLNAFCLPGGYIYVYTGLLKYLDSEDALAGVLGHEMAHADLRHSTDQLVKNMGLSLLVKYFFGVDNSTLLNLGANLLSLSFSRKDERDADLKSVEYLYSTDLDARGAAVFFQRLKKDKKNPEMVEFLSTHPEPENRIETILNKWKELGAKTGKKNSKEYQELIQELP
ncbi:MAG: peptidase M48 [Bacteroidetes bacterium B1(2017)]|nr:MAG: peptidase M48 [Bacteroidetes bacterium B1(2017)]